MHPYSLRAFQWYQECDWGCYNLGNFNVTDKQTNKQPSLISRYMYMYNN